MVQRRRVKLPIKRKGVSRKSELLHAIEHLFLSSGCMKPKNASATEMVRIVTERIDALNELEHLLTEQISICKGILEGLWSNKRLTRP